MANISKTEVTNSEAGEQTTGWEELTGGENKGNQARQFTHKELERIAKATGRPVDDEEVIKLNLALRYKEYKKYLDFYKNAQEKGIMVQQGTMEDIATAKRELEEAMYLYDPSFRESDQKTAGLNSEQKAKNDDKRSIYEAKQSAMRANERRIIEGKERAEELHRDGRVNEQGRNWVQERLRRNAEYDEKRRAVSEKRDRDASILEGKLDDLVDEIKDTEIYLTYELNKDHEPVTKERRDGFGGVGKNGFYDDAEIDWTLYPHAPEDPGEPGDLEEASGDGNPEKTDIPNDGEILGLPGPVLGEVPELPGPVAGEVEIGDIIIEGIEKEFAEDRAERLAALEGRLDKLLPDLAELYARNRRLVVGAENRAGFLKVQGEYGKLLDEYLRLKTGDVYDSENRKNADKIQSRIEELRTEIEGKLVEFAGGDLKNTDKTQEEVDAEKQRLVDEANRIIQEEYGELTAETKEKVDVAFLEEFINQRKKLEEATIDKLDNGTICRKIVNKIINNKVLKGVLVAAAITGLAVTGVGLVAGLAAGTMTIGLGFTAGGIASGALKGGLSGFIMSRQNSKNSAVRSFASEEEIKNQIEDIDLQNQDPDTANVAEWLMGQYNDANRQDRRSNIKKTAISTGIGAAAGAFASGIRINNVSTVEQTVTEQTGTTPVEYNVDAAVDRINVPQGHGIDTMSRQVGIQDIDRAREIAYSIESQFGMSPGSNGVVPGFNGTIGHYAEAYPGNPNDWIYEDARNFVYEWLRKCAEEGLIDSGVIRTGGEPIYDTATKVATEYIPNAFMNFLARATAVVGAGAIGGRVAGTTTVTPETDAGGGTPKAEPTGVAPGVEPTSAVPETEPTNTAPEAEPTNAVPETEPTNTAPEAEPANAAPEAEPTAETTEDQVARDLIDYYSDAIGSLVGSEGAWYMASPVDLNQEEIASWWTNLTPDAQRAVAGLMSDVAALPDGDSSKQYGHSLRQWLEVNSLLNAN